MIIATRIDGRLIHGQVANLWIPKLNVSRVMVVDDDVVNNDIEKSSLKLAVPSGVKLSVLPVEKAAANILAGRYDTQRLMIVVKKPHYLLELVKKGVELSDVNVGNMSRVDGSVSITKSVNVMPEDVADFEALAERSINLVFQMVPSDKAENFIEMLRKEVNK